MNEVDRELEEIRKELTDLKLAMEQLLDNRHRLPKQRTRNLKAFILKCLENAPEGLTVRDVVLEDSSVARASVASLLSKLKRDGIVYYDAHKYRLKTTRSKALNTSRAFSFAGTCSEGAMG